MSKNNFEVGKKVYLSLGINKSRYSSVDYVEGEVTKVGRKYVTVKIGITQYQFDLTDNLRQKTDYAEDYYLYESLEELLDEKRREELARHLSVYFSGSYNIKNKLTLDQMQRIKDIISE
ncbi:hypothetical protein [Paenibacillus sp. NAIST15-1]|uniref:beta barrel domain-containing protein n=1 Tax=Paenibacillus sp. NAIST15-1 TaxID=1605994 RepID=UPI00086A36FC|nr:hypothetical protein [Paenibacillus sp. NAIST15-1]GAV11344.1 hypothetical protein PBN151_1271 [Paenibacillus sp. NAIST15-1]